MKRILLMGCVLCLAGSQGWASEALKEATAREIPSNENNTQNFKVVSSENLPTKEPPSNESKMKGHKRKASPRNQTPPTKQIKTEEESHTRVVPEIGIQESEEERHTSVVSEIEIQEKASRLENEGLTLEDEREHELREAHRDMANEVSRGINPYLNSEKKIDETLWTTIETVAKNYQEQLNSIEASWEEKTFTWYDSSNACSEISLQIICLMSGVIRHQTATSERKEQAQKIKDFLHKSLRKKAKEQGIEK